MNFGAENAGRLVYISPTGELMPLALGVGMAIVNNILILTTPAILGAARLSVMAL